VNRKYQILTKEIEIMITIKTDAGKVRSTCIRQDWYTRGNNEEYSHLLNDMCDFEISHTEESIKAIAEDIFNHSVGFDTDYSREEHIDNIAFYILNDCCTYFIN
jgi:hypothetical protein